MIGLIFHARLRNSLICLHPTIKKIVILTLTVIKNQKFRFSIPIIKMNLNLISCHIYADLNLNEKTVID